MNEHVKIEASSLNQSLVAVMEKVTRLKKDDRNKHGGYDFTSVDDYKDFIRPLMAANGLIPHVNQTKFEMQEFTNSKNERRSVAVFDFKISIEHESGKSTTPEGITVALPFTGPQTSGAARSYAVKEWMKSRFLASSGDEQDEADLIEQSREGLRLSKKDGRELHQQLTAELQEKITGRDYKELSAWWLENKFRTETLPKDWFILLRTEYATAYKELKAEEDLDTMTNDELDAMAEKIQ